jgi:hypothetical protein
MDRPVNIFDKIGSLIPGYSGYAERNNRRQCDKILREKVALTISSIENEISKRIASLIESKELSQLKKVEECRKKLNTISSQVKYAPYGESGFFSIAQLKENELLTIYQKDFALLEKMNEINGSISDVDIKQILKKIDYLEGMLKERNEYLKEFK